MKSYLLAVVFLCCAAAALAQTPGTASLRGRVIDQTGAALPGVAVSVTNVDTGGTREATTDRSGFFAVAALPLTGRYKVAFTLSGFTAKEVDGVALRAGETATVDATLVASGGTSEVTVVGTAETVRTDEPQLGVRLEARKIEGTPVIGRKLTLLPLLDSAVRPAINTGDLFLNNMLFVVNGSGRRQTTFALDGSTADDAWGRQTVFTNVPLSSVQELTVLSSAFSAEYGRTTGAAINIVTKSGTNEVRGDALALVRPGGALQASAPGATVKTPDVLGQFSGSLGGPIVRDRTHYFVSGEYNHQTRDSAFTTPLQPPNTTYTGHYDQVLATGHIDHTLAAGQTLTFKLNADAFTDDNPQGVVGGLSLPSAGREFTRRAYGAQGTYNSLLGSALFNEARVQLFFGSPITRFTPLEPSVQFVYPGFATQGESRFADIFNHQVEVADTISFSRGAHDIRMGASVIHSTSGGNGTEFGSPFVLGQFTVRPGVTVPVASLTAASIQSFTQGFGTTTYEVTDWLTSVFAHDDIKLRPDVTANVGVRYDRQTFTDDTNNLAPRLGATWNVGGDTQTVVRGGYGMFYSQVRSNAAASWNINGPTGVFTFSAQPGQFGFPPTLEPLPAFPPGAVLPPRNITIRPGLASYYQQFLDVSRLKGYPDRLLNPLTHTTSVGIEREVAPRWIASADYVKQHTTGIDRPLDLNSPSPFVRTQAGQVRSAAAADATRPIVPVPNGYRQILVFVNNGIADYDGLQLNLRRSAERYSLLASYTLSKTTNTVEPDVPAQAPNDANETGETERGPSLLDQRHRLVISGSVRLPYDLAFGGVMTAASGYRYNIVTGADNNGDGSNTDRPVVDGVVIGRNTGQGDPIFNVDAFVERAFAFEGERAVIVRVEVFNLFNNSNVAGYNGTYGNGATGSPSASLGTPLTGVANVFPGRQIQFMGRIRF